MEFYEAHDEPAVDNEKLLALAKAGPDFPPEPKSAPKGRSPRVVSLSSLSESSAEEKPEPKRERVTKSGGLQLFGRNPVDLHRRERTEQEKRSRTFKIVAMSTVLVIVAIAIVWRMFFATFSVEAQIESFTWERSVTIERYQTVREQDWSIPRGGRAVSSEWKIRDYEQVLDHYETRTRQVSETVQTGTETYSCGSRDLGNGFFEDQTCSRPTYDTRYSTEFYQEPVYRQEPIYDTYYSYDIEKWLRDRTEKSDGRDQSPAWPAYVLKDETERVSGRTETYSVFFKTVEGETIKREYPEAEWKTMGLGHKFRIDRNRIGLIQAIERL